ncbi:MAG: helix-turn-helix domain-containing protein [Planctomycetota bacterium]
MSESYPRSCCPVAGALDVLGDRWTLLVVRDLMRGLTRFGEFRASPECIASNILTERLERLVNAGLVDRKPDPEDRRRYRYALTTAGEALRPVVGALAMWGLTHLPGTEAKLAPPNPSDSREA